MEPICITTKPSTARGSHHREPKQALQDLPLDLGRASKHSDKMDTGSDLTKLTGAKGLSVELWTPELRTQLALLEQRLRENQNNHAACDIAADLFSAGGKRLRALVSLTVSHALAMDTERALTLTQIVELTHGATLLHDDVIDEATTRRGRPAARVQWSNTLSILGGDYVLSRALRLVSTLDSPVILNAFMETLEALIASEVAQHVAKKDFDISVENYLGIARGKTGSLFAFAASMPPLLLGKNDVAKTLKNAAHDIGVAFQVADDLRDLLGQDSSKTKHVDLLSGVLSLPLRLAAKRDQALRLTLQKAVAENINANGNNNDVNTTEMASLIPKLRMPEAILEAARIGEQFLQTSNEALQSSIVAEHVQPIGHLCAWLRSEFEKAKKSV